MFSQLVETDTGVLSGSVSNWWKHCAVLPNEGRTSVRASHWTWLAVCCVAGLGDMAVSNTIGSNVFDILVGLGVPWAVQTMCVSYGSVVRRQFALQQPHPPPPFSSGTTESRGSWYLTLTNEIKKTLCVDDLLILCPVCVLQVMINSRGLLYSVVLLLGSVGLTVSNTWWCLRFTGATGKRPVVYL